jgi:hypothetical protein
MRAFLLGLLALGIYDSFIVLIAILVLLKIYQEEKFSLRVLIMFVLLLPSNFLLKSIIQRLLSVEASDYTNSFFSFSSLIADPILRIDQTLKRSLEAFSLPKEIFGSSSIWLIVTIGIASSVSIMLNKGVKRIAILLMILVTLLSGIILSIVPFRSMFYLPVFCLILLLITFDSRFFRNEVRPEKLTIILIGLLCISTLSNSMVTSKLQLSSIRIQELDAEIAQKIGATGLSSNKATPCTVVIVGTYDSTKISGVRTTEALALSIFSTGNAERVKLLLRYHGFNCQVTFEEVENSAYSDVAIFPQATWPETLEGSVIARFS